MNVEITTDTKGLEVVVLAGYGSASSRWTAVDLLDDAGRVVGYVPEPVDRLFRSQIPEDWTDEREQAFRADVIAFAREANATNNTGIASIIFDPGRDRAESVVLA